MFKLSAVISNRKPRKQKALQLAALASLVLAAPCAAAPGASVISTMTSTSPGGFLYDGARQWVTDAALGLCRIDGAQLTNCVKPAVASILGQPAYDAVNHLAYVPDSSTASRGIWRYAFGGQVFDGASAFNVAAPAGLGGQRPGAITIGSDGNLYVSMTANGNLVRVHTPAAAAQTVDIMGTTLSGTPAHGLVIVATQLWIADRDGVLIVPDPVGCTTKCKGTLNTPLGVPSPLSIAWDSANGYVYVGTASGVFQHNPSTGQTNLYSGTYVKNAIPGLFSDVTAVGVDPAGNLYLVDDPTAGQDTGGASVYSVPAGSPPDGQGPVPTPPPTVAPTLAVGAALANPANPYSTGLTTPRGAVFMGTHVWVVDATLGFCKMDPSLPAPSLTACAVLPVGVVPGAPAFDKANNLVYVPDTTAKGAGIVRFAFNPGPETVGAATTVVKDSLLTPAAPGSSAPTALAFGPDGQLYAAMAGSTAILRVTTPAAAAHLVRAIGTMFGAGSLNIAFYKSDLFAVETTDASIIHNATLCSGTCTSLFLAVVMNVPAAVAADANFVYFGDAPGNVWRFDPVANIYAKLADSGLLNGNPTHFSSIAGIALDSGNHVFAVDTSRVWEIASGPPAITSLAPFQAPEGSAKTVTITGDNFLPGAVVQTCPAITPGDVSVAGMTQITATFTISSTGPLGACAVTVTTQNGTSAASNFTVLVGPPALTSLTPSSGFSGSATAVTITGANLTGGTVSAGPDVTPTITSITDTQIVANFAIRPTLQLGPVSVIVTTPSGPSNALPFTINAPVPVINGINPPQGSAATTVPVTLSGIGLLGAVLNLPAGVSTAAPPAITDTAIAASLAIAAGAQTGAQSISVTTAGGTSNAVSFTITPPGPTLSSISPASGAVNTTNFIGAAVSAGPNINVTVNTITATQITAAFAIAANATAGAQSVTVTTAYGSASGTFSVVPTLTGIAPASGAASTSVPVTLTGTSLAGATAINAGAGIAVSNLVVVSSTQITATFGIASGAAQGNRNITVTTPAGFTNAVVFNVLPPPPTITSINSPFTRGANNQGVTLSGTNLAGATAITAVQVFLNGTAVPLVVSSTSVAGSMIVQPGSFQTGAAQLRWNWTIPASLPVSGGSNIYTIAVTTPSGTTAPFGLTIQ
jgi:hypothetical protein